MAKIDAADPAPYFSSSTYSGIKDKKDLKNDRARKTDKTNFSDFYDSFLTRTADEIGPLMNLPASEETVNNLMDDVRDTGDRLLNSPLPEEILQYKQAVRNFINYVVNNCYSKERGEGIPNKHRPSFLGRRNTPEGEKRHPYVKIQVIDKKLEDLAAMLLTSQGRQLDLLSRLEEIKGLLIDLMQ